MPQWTMIAPGYGIVHRVVLRGELSRGAKLVYALLCSYANSETSEAFPSQETMATDLRCSEKPIREWLDELVAAGLLLRRLEGMPAHNVYTVMYPVQSGSRVPDKPGSRVPLKNGTTVPAKKTNEKENEPPAPKGGAAPLNGDEHRGPVMTDEEFQAIAAKVPWRKREGDYREDDR